MNNETSNKLTANIEALASIDVESLEKVQGGTAPRYAGVYQSGISRIARGGFRRFGRGF